MKKVIVFVDANNWYHNVKKYFDPGAIDITKTVNLLCLEKGYELVYIKWYASVPSIADGDAAYYKHMSFLENLRKKGIKVITRKLQRLSNEEIIKKKKDTIDSLDLCENCKPLIEANFIDLAGLKRKEKGIDVWVAIDMIKEAIIDKNCDVCLLISGDADFVPALNLIKEAKKEILISMTPLGFSSELIRCFPYFLLKRETLSKCFRDYKDIKERSKNGK